jgi:hypothetical protein
VDCDNCRLIVETKEVCSFCNTPTAAYSYINFTNIDVVTGISSECGGADDSGGSGGPGGTCTVGLTTTRYCVLGCDTATTGSPVSIGTAMDVVTDVVFSADPDDGGLCVTPWMTTACVLCYETEDEAQEPDCVSLISCDTSGGS